MVAGERGKFDHVVTWRLDRLVRRATHFHSLIERANAGGWTIKSATEGFDLATPMGRLIAGIIAMLAEGELEAIRERTGDSRKMLRKLGRWGGGTPPIVCGFSRKCRTGGREPGHSFAGWCPISAPYVSRGTAACASTRGNAYGETQVTQNNGPPVVKPRGHRPKRGLCGVRFGQHASRERF